MWPDVKCEWYLCVICDVRCEWCGGIWCVMWWHCMSCVRWVMPDVSDVSDARCDVMWVMGDVMGDEMMWVVSDVWCVTRVKRWDVLWGVSDVSDVRCEWCGEIWCMMWWHVMCEVSDVRCEWCGGGEMWVMWWGWDVRCEWGGEVWDVMWCENQQNTNRTNFHHNTRCSVGFKASVGSGVWIQQNLYIEFHKIWCNKFFEYDKSQKMDSFTSKKSFCIHPHCILLATIFHRIPKTKWGHSSDQHRIINKLTYEKEMQITDTYSNFQSTKVQTKQINRQPSFSSQHKVEIDVQGPSISTNLSTTVFTFTFTTIPTFCAK